MDFMFQPSYMITGILVSIICLMQMNRMGLFYQVHVNQFIMTSIATIAASVFMWPVFMAFAVFSYIMESEANRRYIEQIDDAEGETEELIQEDVK